MRGRHLGAAALLAVSLAACAVTPPYPLTSPPPSPRPAGAAALPLSALPGWADDDHAADLAAFVAGCTVNRDPRLAAVCRDAEALRGAGEARARAFLEARLVAAPEAAAGVLTAYFTPLYPARHAADAEFSAPLRPAPADLKQRTPYPDRAEIEARPSADALAWLRPEDLFFLQVQGSGVLAFEDGTRAKALYAGANGRPYVPIGRVMRDDGLLAPGQTSAASIHLWLAEHRGPAADAVMRRNPRYAFFRLASADGLAPAGAAGAPLPARRALAVDPAYHPFGEPLWIDADQPKLAGARPRYTGFAEALDTGGAIQGAGRADLYLGEGEAAGAEAGLVDHALRLYRLVPREPGA